MLGSEESYRFTQHGYSIEQGSCLPRNAYSSNLQMDLLGFTGVADRIEDNSSERQGQSVSPRSVHCFHPGRAWESRVRLVLILPGCPSAILEWSRLERALPQYLQNIRGAGT